ncbi:MAG: hypothetical protein R2793_09570 [Flavobacteriaceae bacterium]
MSSRRWRYGKYHYQRGSTRYNQSLVYTFATQGQERINQRILIWTGLNDGEEAAKYSSIFWTFDPANDNHQYFLQGEGNISLERYKLYNGTQGNSPEQLQYR